MRNYQIRYFAIHEFWCPCPRCQALAQERRDRPSVALVTVLDFLRAAWGGPIKINSAVRCAEHNREVGGAASSRHLIGCAADTRPMDRDPALLSAWWNLVSGIFRGIPEIELIKYPTFVHIGVPRSFATWRWGGGLIMF